MHAIYILWLRQLKKYFRSRSRMIGSLGQPILFLLALGYGLGPIYAKAGEGHYIQETLVAPVSRFNIMIGRTLGGATVATFQGIIVFLLSLLFGFKIQNPAMVIIAFIFMFLIAVLFTALGTALASILEDMQGFQLIMNFLVMPIFFLSGALFPLQGLPAALQVITKIDPLSYGVDGIRGALSGQIFIGYSTDITVLVLVSFAFVALGAYLFSKIKV